MVSLINPIAPRLPNPVGLDAEIQRLQVELAARLPWLQVSYGKAYRGSRSEGGKTIYYPEVYAGGREYHDVLPNDNVTAQSFFYPRDPATTGAVEPGSFALPLTQTVDYIFWGNLERINPNDPTRFEASLLQVVLRVLSEGGALVKRVYTSAEEVFKGFSIDTTATQCLRAPFAGFRVQLELYDDNSLCHNGETGMPEPQMLTMRSGGRILLSNGGFVLLRGE